MWHNGDDLMSSSNVNTEYERFVRDIVEAVLHAQGLETVEVQHDVQVQGLSRSHQIDVYWQYRLGGVLHRVIINCKRYAHTVEVTDVLALSGVLQDMPGARGLIVTTVGYQKGAVDYAKTHGIGLKVVRAPQDSDWEGRLRAVKAQFRLNVPEPISCNIQLDSEWVKANVSDPASVTGTDVYDAHTTRVRDLVTGSLSDMAALFNRALRESPTEVGKEGTCIFRWTDARFEQAGKPPLRIESMEFRWRLKPGKALTIDIRSAPDAIVRDAIAGTLLFVDSDGRVTGDVEEEFGRKAGS